MAGRGSLLVGTVEEQLAVGRERVLTLAGDKEGIEVPTWILQKTLPGFSIWLWNELGGSWAGQVDLRLGCFFYPSMNLVRQCRKQQCRFCKSRTVIHTQPAGQL